MSDMMSSLSDGADIIARLKANTSADVINISFPGKTPAFLSRLRAGRFTSPSGVESVFLFDELSRTRGKKSSSHEIADSDTTILQDLGSTLHVFSLDVYFVGESSDKLADTFYDSLFERYTPDAPGVLNHPRWGDRNVIPFGSPQQTERYTTEGGVSRITVEFRETSRVTAQKSPVSSSAGIGKKKQSAITKAIERGRRIAASSAKQYAKFRGIVKDKIATIKDAANSIIGVTADIRAEVEAIDQGIRDALTIGAAPAIILSQVSNMVRTLASIPSASADLAGQIIDMTDEIIDSFGKDISSTGTSLDVQNLGLTYQAIGTACLAAASDISLNASYTAREQVGESIDALVAVAENYNAIMTQAAQRVEGNIIKSFDPDTDIDTETNGFTLDTVALLLDRSFSLKSRRLYTLTHPSDPLTETWTRYGDMNMLDFFCETNKVTMNEFIELPAGRVIAVYE